MVLKVEEFLSKCSNCEIWVNLSKLKDSHFFGYHCVSGGQCEFIQKVRESKNGRERRKGIKERGESRYIETRALIPYYNN